MSHLSLYTIYTEVRKIGRLLLWLCLVYAMLVISGNASAEGSKQLEPKTAPPTSICKLVLSKSTVEFRIPFALIGCEVDFRLNIHISDFSTEKIYLGFGNVTDYTGKTNYTDVQFQVRDPKGTIVKGYALSQVPHNQGSNGFISTPQQVEAGPNINAANPQGYDPLIILPGMNGDYFIEFRTPDPVPTDPDINVMRILKYFDATVARGNTLIPGRLWSKAWQLSSGSVLASESASFSLFYIYTNDSIVTRFDCNGLAGGVWTIYSNQWGCSATGAWSDRRRSIPGNASVRPEYKIFLNDPDPVVFPSGHIGAMIDFKVLKEECDTVITFATHVSKGGNIEIMLDAPPLNPGSIGPEDVQLGYNVTAGYNVLLPAWDGKNGLGIPIANGTEVKARVSFLNGLSNVPLYDVEDNPKGFKVDIQRPMPASGVSKLKLFWDDTNLPSRFYPSGNVTDGCLYNELVTHSGCHEWTGILVSNNPPRFISQGDTNTINTWWYLTTDQVFERTITLKLRPSSGNITGPANICDGQEVRFRTSAISFAREYIWHISGPGVGFDFKAEVPDTTLNYGFPISWPQGIYDISVFGRNPQCFDGEKVFYTSVVHNIPVAEFSHDNPCQGAGITFTDKSIPADAILNKFTWTIDSPSGAERLFNGNPVVIVFDTAINVTVNLIASDLFGCTDTVSRIITIKPKPASAFQYIENPNANGELNFDNQTTGASAYFWDFGNTITSTLNEPFIKYNLEGDYAIMLIASNTEHCVDTAISRYYYMPGLWMPNAFSPNADTYNDFFGPVTQRTTLEPYQLLVFDRWGQLVFKTATPTKGWDGTLNGIPCPAGSYSYLLQYREGKIDSSEIITKRGMVSLIR